MEEKKLWKKAVEKENLLRGGMNRFQPLQEVEEEDEAIEESTVSDPWIEEVEYGEEGGGEELDTSMESDVSGKRSFYREFFQKKADMPECRGGAGGANASKNKQLTEAMDALTKVMKAIGEEEKDEEVSAVVKEIGKVVKEWESKPPTKAEICEHLRKFHKRLEEKARAPVQPTPSGETDKRQQQSFYTEFARSIRQEEEPEWKTKGKGKGKTKSKGKKEGKEVANFDLRRDFPQRRIGPWQLVAKELESGKEATASITVLDWVRCGSQQT